MSLGRHLSRLGSANSLINLPRSHQRSLQRLTAARTYTSNAISLANSLKSPSSPLSDIHKSFHALVSELKRTAYSRQAAKKCLITADELIQVLIRLAQSGRPFDIGLMDAILAEMSTSFGVDPKVSIHSAIIDTLVQHGDCQTLFTWLQTMPRKPGNVTPSRSDWHTLLEKCDTTNDVDLIKRSLDTMKKTGCRPNITTFKIVLRAYFDSYLRMDEICALFEIMANMKIPFDLSIEALLSQAAPSEGEGERLRLAYRKSCRHLSEPLLERIEKTEQLSDEAHCNGIKSALRMFREFQQQGIELSLPDAIRSMLQHSKSLSDLQLLEEQLGFKPDVIHWSLLIRNLIRVADLSGALEIYAASKKASIRPDAKMVDPILRSLCRTTIAPPTNFDIDQAYHIYRDLLDTEISTAKGRQGGPDTSIYQLLLRAMAAFPKSDEYYEVAVSLLEDMNARGLSMNDSVTTASVIILMMRNSSSFEQAFAIYRRLHVSLDGKGYPIVLNAFCKLPFDLLPSVRLYFEIVKDMRRAGHRMNATVYTILLQQLARFHTQASQRQILQSDPELHQRLVKSIRRAHDFLTLDGGITPDAALWNQLMDTYQRIGCFGDAYRVWDMLYISNQFDHASVSIILDACGRAGSLYAARQVKVRLVKKGFMLNQKNWHSWIECLCRLGRLDEALKILCMDMGKDQVDIKPDMISVDIVRSFGRKAGLEDEVIERVKKYLPELWEDVKCASGEL